VIEVTSERGHGSQLKLPLSPKLFEAYLYSLFRNSYDAYFLNYKLRSRKCATLLQNNASENFLIMHLLCIFVHACNIRRLKKTVIKYIAYNYRSFSVLLHSI